MKNRKEKIKERIENTRFILRLKNKYMTNYSAKKILVIGSYNHRLADKCAGWDFIDSLYFGDYHLLILNLQTLYGVSLNEEMGKKLEKMRKQINEIIWANTEIICITAPTIKRGNISNYDWSPIYLNFVAQSGESFKDKPKGGYFDFVKKWTHLLESWDLKPYILKEREAFLGGKRNHIDIRVEPLLKNLAEKLLAFKIIFEEFNAEETAQGEAYNARDFIFSNSITFLPPPTEITIDEAIDHLLKEERGMVEIKETPLPVWTEKIKIFGEDEIQQKVKEKEIQMKALNKELEENKKKLKELIKFKRLLTADGEELENIVEEALKTLGIKVYLKEKYKEDRVVIDPITNSEVPIEITGTKNSIPQSKLNQLIGRLVSEEQIKNIKCECKGILIGNHYKDTPLDGNLQSRKKPFEPNVIEKAKASKICLLSTIEVFKAINAKLAGKNIENFVKTIFNTPGEVFFKEI